MAHPRLARQTEVLERGKSLGKWLVAVTRGRERVFRLAWSRTSCRRSQVTPSARGEVVVRGKARQDESECSCAALPLSTSRADNDMRSLFRGGIASFEQEEEPGQSAMKSLHRLVEFWHKFSVGKFERRSGNARVAEEYVLDLDLVTSHPSLAPRSVSPVVMGQKPSSLWTKPKISLAWALKTDIPIMASKPSSLEQNKGQNSRKNCQGEARQKADGRMSEPKKNQRDVAAGKEGKRCEERRSISPTSSTSTSRTGRRRRLRRVRPRAKSASTFGYEIQDVDEFLTKASLDSPGNIPMVLSRPCVLYETHEGRPQREVALPLGMVVNGVLKNRAWLYAQTPHGEEGYVPYACCLPLGILPAPSRPQPCWDTQTDIFPRPSGNRTDREKLRDETRSECGLRPTTSRKRLRRDSGERNVDCLYLRASRKPPTRETLLVVGADYKSMGNNRLSVCKGDVVSLVSSHLKDWFWVRNRDGKEGFIPAVVAGHGFL